MKNPLFEAFINDLVMLGEVENKTPRRTQGDPVVPDGLYAGKAPGTYYRDAALTQYVGMKRSGKWIPASDTDSSSQKPKGKNTEPTTISQKGVSRDNKKVSILPISSKSQQAGMGKLHDELSTLLQNGDPTKLTQFMEKYGIVFDERKNTFYVLSVKGREQKKIFGDGSKSAKGVQQRELFDRLKEMGVDVHLRDTYIDPLKPEGIVPKSQQKEFDGKREGDTITFDGQKFELIPQGKFKDHITQQTKSWITNFTEKNGRKPTRKEIDQASRQFVILADAMNKRYRILEKLMQRSTKNPTPHKIGSFEGEQGTKQYIDNVRQSLLLRVPEGDTKLREEVETKLKAVEDSTSDDAAPALVDLFRLIEKTDEFSGSAASVAESLSIMLELKRGRKVIVPMSDNFKAADLITLSTDGDVDPTKLSLEELADRVRVVYSSVSVKREEGAASSMIEKFRMSVFSPDHEKTLGQLEKLSSGYSVLFSDDEDTRNEKEQEIRRIVGENIELIKKYYNLPSVKNVDDLVKILGNGGVECIDGKTTPRSLPSFMQNQGVNKRAYMLTHLMQYSAEAIGNSKVIAQGFGNHFWGGRGVGFLEIDGITMQVKQKSEPNKRQRGVGPKQMPDYMVSHNTIPGPKENLRSGDPCKEK